MVVCSALERAVLTVERGADVVEPRQSPYSDSPAPGPRARTLGGGVGPRVLGADRDQTAKVEKMWSDGMGARG